MARLPIPGSDENIWGDVLNDFLAVEHNSNGTLKKAADITAKYTKPSGGIPKSDLASTVQDSLTVADNAAIDAQVKADAAEENAKSYTDSEILAQTGLSVVLIWDPLEADYVPTSYKAAVSPKEFRGPVDPSTVSGVVLNTWDAWTEG